MEIVWRHSSDPEAYEKARLDRQFNRRVPNRYPRAVVSPRTESEIVEAVQLARKIGCRVAVRSGGHSFPAWGVRDNSILIDLGNYHEIDVDKEKRTARVSPSTTGRVLDTKLTQEYGLMFGGGHCPDVGMGGLLLQGGMGWNCRNWGWSCERLDAVDAVTADGKLVHCNLQENSDLFWAARGAGPGFPGVVTRFHVQLRPAPRVFRSSGYIFPASMYQEAFDWVLKITPTFDESTEISAVGHYPPGLDQICFAVFFITMKDTVQEAEEALLPAQQTRPEGALQEWFCKEDSLAQEYDNQDAAYPSNRRYRTENAFIRNDADVPAVLKDAFLTLPTNQFAVLWYPMYPCSRRKLPDMAVSLQSDHYVAIYSFWEDEKDDEKCTSWVHRIIRQMERSSEGSYLGDADFEMRVSKYWGDAQGQRLKEIRQKWDPEGRICGYLDASDISGSNGLPNRHEWKL
ncbi:hypothetical protein NW754_001468 [Fusarium falciforme]|nr:hypothetical protein NW754_001468 [Fusarium falciforme]